MTPLNDPIMGYMVKAMRHGRIGFILTTNLGRALDMIERLRPDVQYVTLMRRPIDAGHFNGE